MHFSETGFIYTAWITCVPVIFFVIHLIAGHAQFIDIDDNDVVAGVNMWRIDGFMLAAQAMCNC